MRFDSAGARFVLGMLVFAIRLLEHASMMPFPESSIAGTAAAELLGNRLPLAVGAKAIEDATQHDSVGRGRTSTFVVPTNGWSRKQPLDAVPQLVLAREG